MISGMRRQFFKKQRSLEELNPVLQDPDKLVENFEKVSPVKNMLGKIFAAIFSLGCGVTAAAGFMTLPLTGPIAFVGLIVLSLSTIYSNFRMTKNDVPKVLVGGLAGLFQKKIIVATDADIDTGVNSPRHKIQYLSSPRTVMLIIGMGFSMTLGACLGALTYMGTLGLPVAFGFLSAISVALPPVGIVLGVFTFVSVSCLMVYAFSEALKIDNLKTKIKKNFLNVVSRDPERDKGKSTARFVLERAAVLLGFTALAGATMALIYWGVFNVLLNCSHAIANILTAATSLPAPVITTVSNVLTLGVSLAAQVPFILKTSLLPILKLFSPPDKKANVEKTKKSWREIARFGFLLVTSVVGALGTGMVALPKNLDIASALAGVGAFMNGVLSNVVNATISEPVHLKTAAPRPALKPAPKSSHRYIYERVAALQKRQRVSSPATAKTPMLSRKMFYPDNRLSPIQESDKEPALSPRIRY